MRKLTFSIIALVALMTLAAAPGFAAKKYGGNHTYKAELIGKEETPPVDTMAKGIATFEPEKWGKELRFKVTVEDIEGVTAAHIHLGKKGAEVPVVAGLFGGPKKEGKFSGTLAEGTITNKDLVGPLSGKTFKDLIGLIKKGELYVNVHTEKHPGGELRGEIK